MKKKVLLTTLLSITLLPLNLTAQSKLKCTGSHCYVDISGISDKKNVKQAKASTVKTEAQLIEERYSTVILDDVETIIFSKERYIMTDDEIGEYELDNALQELTTPVLSGENLPTSEYYCEDNLKPVKVQGLLNTYECT